MLKDTSSSPTPPNNEDDNIVSYLSGQEKVWNMGIIFQGSLT